MKLRTCCLAHKPILGGFCSCCGRQGLVKKKFNNNEHIKREVSRELK